MADDSTPITPSPEAVREELKRILASAAFAGATRPSRFLSYLVEQTLAGRSDGIKEIVLGTEVFDRAPDFDPRIDTIVRVEAVKLRKRLDEYYAAGPGTTTVRIEVPRGSYVPRFHVVAPTETPADGPPSVPAPTEVHVPSTSVVGASTPLVSRRVLAAAAAMVLLAMAGWAAWRTGEAKAPAANASIAVLPFQNFSPDPGNEYLADGLAEDLTDALSRHGGLRVVARTSAYAYKGRSADVREIGARLDVLYVIEGSVRREGDRLKITAQLVRTDDGYHLWSQSFERDVGGVLAVQAEIARRVVESVASVTAGRPAPARAYVPSPVAFDLYLKGIHAAGTDLVEGERLLRASIAAAPGYARPHVALARVYVGSDIFGLRPTSELAAKARAEVEAALSLDPDSAEAHAMFGSVLARHWYQWDEAESALRRALELDPNSSLVHNELAQNVLAPQERWDEALAETQRAQELDPLSTSVAAGKAFLLFLRRDTPAAIEAFREAVERNPGPLEVSGLFLALIGAGKVDDAVQVVQGLGPMARAPMIVAMRGHGLGRAGRLAEAQAALRELEAQPGQFVSALYPALVYSGLGDRDRAFRALALARQQQSSGLIFLRFGVFFDSLRSDRRFATLLSDVGLSDQDLERRRGRRDDRPVSR